MFCQRMRGLLLAGLFIPLLGAGAAGAWDGAGGVIAVTTWAGPEAVDLAPLAKDCWMLAHNEDMAVLLVPGGYQAPGELSALITPVEPPASAGGYFFYLVEDAARARFAGSTRILAAHGHTALVWTNEEVPQLAPESRAALRGLIQPVWISMAPKAWPAAAAVEPEGRPRARTEFHPIVDQIVQDVTEQDYVAKWQVLDDFETRYYSTAQNEASSQWMYDYFVSLGLQAQFHTYQQSGTRRNVIGILPGLVNPEKVVYLCGHFDSTSESPQTSAPGADDNASGTAAFLEAARVLSQYAFHYTIKLVGFNGEEQGLVGSNAYVAMISSQGEDVVGCFNLDMIAYRGTDPAPADLVIYTNTASLPIAEVFEDACLEYFPTLLEPLVTNSSMTGSDHASFWSYGYKAICGIEDEAWGSDFCPWYHTTQDRIEQYPHDYPTHCATAAIAATAQTAIPMQPEVPYLALDSWTIDDDAVPPSSGNGNGAVEYSERIELDVTLKNLGLPTAQNVSAVLSTADSYVVLQVAQTTFGSIPGSGGLATSATPLVFAVRPDVPDGRIVDFTLTLSEQPGAVYFSLAVAAPQLAVVAYEADDTVGGDGDGIPEPGETIVMMIAVANEGAAAVTDVSGALTGGAFLEADPTPFAYGTLAPGASVNGGPFTVAIDPGAPSLCTSYLTVGLTGALDYQRNATFSFNIGDVFADDLEDAGLGWTHYVGGTGFTDQWHIETYRNHTFGGTYSYKCGGQGAANYANLLHAVLESSPFTLPAGGVLTFWHWIRAETSSAHAGYCYDGGQVQISIDGGPWQVIAPDGGYPYRIRTGSNPGPFPAETPVYSGSYDWQLESFDLAGFTGSARVRFVFGSDGADVREGWYVDDLALIFPTSSAGDRPLAHKLTLHPARPNPVAGAATLLLDLPASGPVDVRVFDATGRQVRALHAGELAAGRHSFTWDGLTAEGTPAGSGVYWVKAHAGSSERGARVVLLR